MPIRVNVPKSSTFTIADIADIVDFIAVDGIVSSVSATSFTGSGSFFGQPASFTVTGTGFSLGQIGGINYVTSGIVSDIVFTVGGQAVSFSSVDIDMSVFAPVIHADETGSDVLAIEKFLLARDWSMLLGGADDIAPKGTLVGDGYAFNLAGKDVIRGRDGDDNLFSGDGNDLLDGGRGNDILDGGLGRDRVFGGKGRDEMYGSGGADKMFGEEGADRIFGGNGRDIIDTGSGNDFANGGGGSDIFIFHDLGGTDRINGFAATDDNEKIDLSDVSAIVDFADLSANHMVQSGTKVVIDDGAGTRIILANTDINDLHSVDFIF